eukprot:tig00021168_g19109.t1
MAAEGPAAAAFALPFFAWAAPPHVAPEVAPSTTAAAASCPARRPGGCSLALAGGRRGAAGAVRAAVAWTFKPMGRDRHRGAAGRAGHRGPAPAFFIAAEAVLTSPAPHVTAFTCNLKRLIYCRPAEEEDQSPEALDAAERRRLQKRNGSHKAGVMCVRWSKTGQWHGGVVKSVAVAPSDAYIASGSWDRTLRIWATSISGSYEQLAQIGGHSGIIHSVGWSPDGRLLVSGSEDRTMRIWEIKTDGGGWVSGKETKVVSGLAPNVTSCFFAGDGRRLIASVGNAIKIFDVGSGCKELRSAIVSDAPIKCLSVDDTVQGRTRLVASCEAGGRDVVRVYEVEAMIQSDKARFSEYSVQGLGERSAAHVHAYGDATKRTTASPRSVVACAFYNPPAAVSEAAIELRPNVVVASDPGKLLSTHTDAGQRVCAFEGFAPFTCVDSCGARIAAGDFVGNVYALSSVLFQ